MEFGDEEAMKAGLEKHAEVNCVYLRLLSCRLILGSRN